MQKVNSESLVSSLLLMGFEKVDVALCTILLCKLYSDNNANFTFVDTERSQFFSKYIYFDGFFYKLKESISLNTNVSDEEGCFKSLENELSHNNKELISYLRHLDFREIIRRKMELFEKEKIEEDDLLFCEHEREIIQDKETKKVYSLENTKLSSHKSRVENPVSIHDIVSSIESADERLKLSLEKEKHKPNQNWPPLWRKK